MDQQELRDKLIESVKINSVDSRGYYITERYGNYYLYDSGQISSGVVDGEGNAFWETEEEAWAFYNGWRLA